jgi:hypothetical protein
MSLKLVLTDKQFSDKVYFLLAKTINPRIEKAINPIQNRIRELMVSKLRSSSIVDELSGYSISDGSLALDFGLTPELSQAAVSQMLEAIRASVSVQLTRGGKLFTKGFSGISIRIDPVGSIEGIPAGSYNSNGHIIDWMDWLLNKGSQVVVNGFETVFTVEYDANSRSGFGFMIPTGNSFRVDPKFAGTKDNNFLTRIVSDSLREIENIVKEEMNKVL